MKLLFGLILWASIFSLDVHDIALSKFDMSQEEDRFYIQVQLDKEDIKAVLPSSRRNADFASYLSKHFALELNGAEICFDIQSVEEDQLYFNLKMSSSKTGIWKVQKVTLKNTCLIETVADQSNICLFELNGKRRMFRLHEGRKTIDFQY